MKEVVQESLLNQVLELFETGEEAVNYLEDNGLEGQEELICQIRQMCISLDGAIKQLSGAITLQNRLGEIGKNILSTVERVSALLSDGQIEEAQNQFHCTMAPLLLFWHRYATFLFVYAADLDSLNEWHEQEREWFRKIRQTIKVDNDCENKYQYDFSIIVLFYGNRKMTEDCINAISKYTTHSYELITFDNGSDPETTQWCQGLPHKKKIYYPYNMGSSTAGNLIYTMAHRYAQGKYLMFISNDVIVTPRYDDILFRCIESDPRIAVAVPVCNSASNLQAISVPYSSNNMQEMIDFANKYNHYDPSKWYDRSRLFAIMGCYRMQPLKNLYLGFSPLFCYDMFADDDQSCSLRRMGYRQVLCNDVFVHHYGSATIGAGQFEVMDKARKQFYQKHGVDAWNSLATTWNMVISGLQIKLEKNIRLLALEPKFGEGILAVCNRLNATGTEKVSVDAVTYDKRYLDDLEGLFDCGVSAEEAFERLEEIKYDGAVIGISLEECPNLLGLAKIVGKLLPKNAFLLVIHKNPYNIRILHQIISGQIFDNDLFNWDINERPQIQWITDNIIKTLFGKFGFEIVQSRSIRDESIIKVAEDYVKQVPIQSKQNIIDRLSCMYKITLLRKTNIIKN